MAKLNQKLLIRRNRHVTKETEQEAGNKKTEKDTKQEYVLCAVYTILLFLKKNLITN